MSWRDEIIGLHRFFEDWFLGRGGEMKRAEDALHPDFSFIGPDGVVADRATTLQRLVDGHAHTTDLAIETVDHRMIRSTGDTVVARYVERHRWTDGRSNERISTVVFIADTNGPNGVRWLHVQETWLGRADDTGAD